MTYKKSFIETQFPVSKISKESYKERMANNGQTLTGLGKWWGRKPLILVRAVILGLLIPASNDPKKDRAIFLKILSMDDDGLWSRKEKDLTISQYYEKANSQIREMLFEIGANIEEDKGLKFKEGLNESEKRGLQKRIFSQLSYDERLIYCLRPEEAPSLSSHDWKSINEHLNTKATDLKELIVQLGFKQFGHIPKVGDAFSGGGSIPFEAARIGCEAFGSDLNPVAAILTWAGLNIIGGGEEIITKIRQAQKEVYENVDKQITEWGIEHNKGWRADVYLYCVEARCPVTGYLIPLSPNWVIGEKSKTIARLVINDVEKKYEVEIHSGVSDDEMLLAKNSGTVKDGYIINPTTGDRTSIQVLRGDRTIRGETTFGSRMWENEDLEPLPTDVFRERLYCIRYLEPFFEVQVKIGNKKAWKIIDKVELETIGNYQTLIDNGTIRLKTRKHYRAPNAQDLENEKRVLSILRKNFREWQIEGYIPSSKIERGLETTRLQRERGWTYWHHLFTPRQLLTNGLFQRELYKEKNKTVRVALLLGLGKITDWNSKLSVWDTSAANERVANTFLNQALNPLYRWGCRPLKAIANSWFYEISAVSNILSATTIEVGDASQINQSNDIWITDPPYADAVNYHELADYFLSWYSKQIEISFPEWYTDSKKALAVKGSGEDFRIRMVSIYSNLNRCMPANGAQLVMFTHQNSSVWADLALILWGSGLQVSAAWTIATETNSGLKSGNYVQGTVCMVLRKQTSIEETFINDVYPEIEQEVINQLKTMTELDDKDDPNFSDSDYQLAAYAAALRILTKYKKIHPINVQYELTKPRVKGEKNEVEKLIDKSVIIATNYLIPEGLEKELWIGLGAEEKFYLKGLEVETHGEYRSGVYQEFARGFGVKDYKIMLSSNNANETRLRSALEFKNKNLSDEGFGSSILRKVLFAIHETNVHEDPNVGKRFLKDEVNEYWQNRQKLVALTRYIQKLSGGIEHRKEDEKAANLLAGALENDHL